MLLTATRGVSHRTSPAYVATVIRQ